MKQEESSKRITVKQLKAELEELKTVLLVKPKLSYAINLLSLSAAIALVVITYFYWKTTDGMLTQMQSQTNQARINIDELKKSNNTMRDAYAEAIKNNQIVQTQLEIQIEQSFSEKVQLHYELKEERDRIVNELRASKKRSNEGALQKIPEYNFIQGKLEANYEAMEDLVKRYTPLGGKLATLDKDLPSKKDLSPPRHPGRLPQVM